MKLRECIKPVSYVKAHMSELLRKLNDGPSDPIIITQNGEAAGVLMGVGEFEKIQESIAMMRLISMSERDIAEGRSFTVEETFAEIDQMLADLEEDKCLTK